MTNLKSTKEQITEVVLNEIPNHGYTLEKAIFNWWYTGRQSGLRLTDQGLSAFQEAEIEYYDHEFYQDGKSYYSFIGDLNKKIKCPYYIGYKKLDNGTKTFYIRLYDSKIAMMMKLYGTLQEYLDSIKERK